MLCCLRPFLHAESGAPKEVNDCIPLASSLLLAGRVGLKWARRGQPTHCHWQCAAGRLEEEGPALTASAWRLLRWAADYGGLMRAQRSQAGHVFSGMAELFELYLLHAFHTFSDVPLSELAHGSHMRQVGAMLCLLAMRLWACMVPPATKAKCRMYGMWLLFKRPPPPSPPPPPGRKPLCSAQPRAFELELHDATKLAGLAGPIW